LAKPGAEGAFLAAIAEAMERGVGVDEDLACRIFGLLAVEQAEGAVAQDGIPIADEERREGVGIVPRGGDQRHIRAGAPCS
jgi:hypothetical protein